MDMSIIYSPNSTRLNKLPYRFFHDPSPPPYLSLAIRLTVPSRSCCFICARMLFNFRFFLSDVENLEELYSSRPD